MLFKKIATILLLSFLFFNWVGYWLFISLRESHVETIWEARLENDDRKVDIANRLASDGSFAEAANLSNARQRECRRIQPDG